MSEKYFYKGKPLRVLSTSLGVVLAANMMLAPAAFGETGGNGATGQPTLVEASNEAVKAYYDPATDWNIPLPEQKKEDENAGAAGGSGGSGEGGSGGNSQVVINNGGFGGGFGWDDLLLYHLILGSGRSYSSSGWYGNQPVYDARTNKPYKAKSFGSDSFQNKPVENSTVRPKTSSGKGSFTTKSSKSSSSKSTSSSPGGIGSKSSGFSSSGKSSGSSFGS